jgi:hypothetical protein
MLKIGSFCLGAAVAPYIARISWAYATEYLSQRAQDRCAQEKLFGFPQTDCRG